MTVKWKVPIALAQGAEYLTSLSQHSLGNGTMASATLASLGNEETVVKQRTMEYAVCMNNREWYTEAMRFCQLSASCATCPYQLLTGALTIPSSESRPCFSSKEALLALDAWLSEEHACSGDGVDMEGDDHKWLQDLLRLQFHEEESEEDAFFDDDLF